MAARFVITQNGRPISTEVYTWDSAMDLIERYEAEGMGGYVIEQLTPQRSTVNRDG